MKKVVIIAIVLLLAVTFSAAADTLGIGGAFSLSAVGGLPNSVLLSLKLPATPFLFGVGAQLGDNFNVAITADWWLFTTSLAGALNLYAGPGVYVAVPDPFQLGARIPVGINIYPIPILELFLEVAPTVEFIPNIPEFGLQGAFGFRFWFDI